MYIYSSISISKKLRITHKNLGIIINRRIEDLKKLGEINIQRCLCNDEKVYYFNLSQCLTIITSFYPKRKNKISLELKKNFLMEMLLKSRNK